IGAVVLRRKAVIAWEVGLTISNDRDDALSLGAVCVAVHGWRDCGTDQRVQGGVKPWMAYPLEERRPLVVRVAEVLSAGGQVQFLVHTRAHVANEQFAGLRVDLKAERVAESECKNVLPKRGGG